MKNFLPKTRNSRLALGAGGALGLIIVVVLLWPGSGKDKNGVTYTARRQNLVINVLEGGNVVSTRSLEIKSQVEGQTQIISIVPDGTVITEQDVRDGKVLVELESADLVEKAAQQEITFQSGSAAYTQAKESYEIQKNQNESNIKAGELDEKFARMDLEKYLGAPLAGKVLSGEANLLDPSWTESGEDKTSARLKKRGLGGNALQQILRLEADIDLASEELERAKVEYEWSETLGPQEDGGAGYISRSDLVADKLAFSRRQVELELAKPALRLFLQYEFPKEAEKLLSDYVEAGRELERIKARARSELAKANAELTAREATYNVQKERLEKLRNQTEHCVIRATKPGMVVYPSTAFRWGRSQDKIEEGATVRERQVIITIPDPTSMAVNVKINEASVHKVKPGQPVRIVPEPFPDMTLWGRVEKVAVLPDPQNPFFSPDLKVYDSTILIDNPPPLIKPGMSAKVDIIIARLSDVIAVPVQAVTTRRGQRVCYVVQSRRAELRPVETGQSNDSFIRILDGLREGEKVLLHAPDVPQAGEPAQADLDETLGEATSTGPPGEGESETAPPESPTTPPAEADIEKILEGIPAEYREAARKRWEEASPEERAKMLERFQQGGGAREGRGRRRQEAGP